MPKAPNLLIALFLPEIIIKWVQAKNESMPEKQQLKYAFGSIIFVHTEMVFLFPGIIRNLFW